MILSKDNFGFLLLLLLFQITCNYQKGGFTLASPEFNRNENNYQMGFIHCTFILKCSIVRYSFSGCFFFGGECQKSLLEGEIIIMTFLPFLIFNNFGWKWQKFFISYLIQLHVNLISKTNKESRENTSFTRIIL